MTDVVSAGLPEGAAPSALNLTLFVLGSAALYTAAMIAMKHWGTASPVIVLLVIVAAVSGGVILEINALRTERLAMVYVLILGAECILIALASALWFGESFTVREMVGGAMIVVGTAIAWI
ncbi:MAG: hypothetical protein AAGD13_14400 [Pseudomonadota bacterium]